MAVGHVQQEHSTLFYTFRHLIHSGLSVFSVLARITLNLFEEWSNRFRAKVNLLDIKQRIIREAGKFEQIIFCHPQTRRCSIGRRSRTFQYAACFIHIAILHLPVFSAPRYLPVNDLSLPILKIHFYSLIPQCAGGRLPGVLCRNDLAALARTWISSLNKAGPATFLPAAEMRSGVRLMANNFRP